MSSVTDHKLQKKIARSIALLKKHIPHAEVSDVPEKTLYVANSGAVCGVTLEDIEQCFSVYGLVQDVYAWPGGVPFTLVVMASPEAAADAVRALQGTHPSVVAGNPNVVFYLAYLRRVPEGIRPDSSPEQCPAGLHSIDDFISDDEAIVLESLVADLDAEIDINVGNKMKNRRVYHFGYEFLYGSNTVDLDRRSNIEPIPTPCHKIIDRIMGTGLIVARPDQLTVNVYEAGQGIPLHTDTHSAFEDSIVSLSLESQVSMEFRHPSDPHRDTSVVIPPRTLLVMTGESRYVWKHGISPRKHDCLPNGRVVKRNRRVSFTFRAVRRQPCQCEYPTYCDWKRPLSTLHSVEDNCAKLPSTSEEASRLETKYVAQVYDAIADHFDVTRHSQWRSVVDFLGSLPSGALLLDVGCGNGKYLTPSPQTATVVKFGCDVSVGQCAVCRGKGVDAIAADCLSLPFDDRRFDAVISVAVLHHLSNESRRLQAIRELLRVLAVGGRALITVWAFEQRHDGGDGGTTQTSTYLRWGASKHDNRQHSAAGMPQSPVELKGTTAAKDNRGGVLVAAPPVTLSAEPYDVVSGQNEDAMFEKAPVEDQSRLPIHVNMTEFRQQDLLVPWQHKKQRPSGKGANSEVTRNADGEERTFLRFYHVFREGELECVCRQSGGCEVERCFYEQGNWIIILRKV